MTEILNAEIAAGASSADLTVAALEPHGVNTEVACRVAAKNATSGTLHTLARLRAGEAVVVFPTTATLVIQSLDAAAGVVQVTAK